MFLFGMLTIWSISQRLFEMKPFRSTSYFLLCDKDMQIITDFSSLWPPVAPYVVCDLVF